MTTSKIEIENKIYNVIKSQSLFDECNGLILAVSGGSDSMALLRFFIEQKSHFDFPFVVAHVNHKLRKEADDEELGLKEFCNSNNIPFYSVSVDIAATKRTASTEDYARNVRYAYFDILRKQLGYSHIATAHNMNDNTESFFLNIIRGCGTDGAGGIQTKRKDNIVRPLLTCTKDETIQYCNLTNTPFFTDKSNFESIYTRNKLRNDILPLMREINPSLDDAVSRLMTTLNDDNTYLASEAEKFLVSCDHALKINALKSLPQCILARVIKNFASLNHINLSFNDVNNVSNLIRNGQTSDKVEIDGQTSFIRDYSTVKVVNSHNRYDNVINIPKTEVILDSVIRFKDFDFVIKETIADKSNIRQCFCFNFDSPLYVRSRIEGDKIKLHGRNTKSIKKLFIDDKIPSEERNVIPILVNNENVVWLSGYGADEKYAPILGERCFIVCITKNEHN